MQTDTPNIDMLSGILSVPTLIEIKKGGRLKQSYRFKKVTLQLRKELGDTEETRKILDRIRPIHKQ